MNLDEDFSKHFNNKLVNRKNEVKRMHHVILMMVFEILIALTFEHFHFRNKAKTKIFLFNQFKASESLL